MSPLSRRGFFGLGAAAGAVLLPGCSTPGMTSVNTQPVVPAATGPVNLTYWSWLKDLQKVCDIWNADNPNVQVEATWLPSGNSGGYQKMYTALAAGGTDPDLAQVEFRTVPEFMLVNGVVDLARYGANDYADRFDPTLWGQVSYVGGVFGIPQDSGPMATFYRPDLLAAVDAEPPVTWDDWASVAAELRRTNVYIDCFALADASWFTAIATQAGASWLRVDGDSWVIDMTDDATLDTARFFDKAIDDDLVTTAFGPFSTPWFAAAGAHHLGAQTTGSGGEAQLPGGCGAASTRSPYCGGGSGSTRSGTTGSGAGSTRSGGGSAAGSTRSPYCGGLSGRARSPYSGCSDAGGTAGAGSPGAGCGPPRPIVSRARWIDRGSTVTSYWSAITWVIDV